MALDVLGIIELLCCLWSCAYAPNCNLQSLLKSILEPVIIIHGLSVGCMLSLCWKQFNWKTAL